MTERNPLSRLRPGESLTVQFLPWHRPCPEGFVEQPYEADVHHGRYGRVVIEALPASRPAASARPGQSARGQR